MFVCRPRPRRVVALSIFSAPPTRSTFTSTTTTTTSTSKPAPESTSQPAEEPRDSIFTAPESPWDHVFSDIESAPPLPPSAQRIRARLSDGTPRSAAPSRRPKDTNQNLVQRSSGVRQQRASLTAREMSVFDEMFDMIFNAVSAKDGKSPSSSSAAASGSSRTPGSAVSGQMPGIGPAGAPLNDLFRTLRRHTSRVRWTTDIDEELDRKKETMELFNTDHELLQWVTKKVFGEAQRWDEEAQRAMAASSANKTNEGKGKDGSAAPAGSFKEYPGNHSIYPYLIAHAMRIFRTTYSNPSLSLAIFNHAARVSIPSYVFGCTAPAYNEMIEAKWEGWGDLEGVCNALEEMRANGVKIDGRTRIVVEKVRREVGEARPVELGEPTLEPEERVEHAKDVNLLARRVWGRLGEVEVARLLHRIEQVALRDRSRKSARSSPHEESWKHTVQQSAEDDGWRFDGWDGKKQSRDIKKQRQRTRFTPQRKIDPGVLDDWTVSATPEEERGFH